MAIAARQWGGPPQLQGDEDDGGEEEEEEGSGDEAEAGRRRGTAAAAAARTPPLTADELTRQLAAALMPDRASETRCGPPYPLPPKPGDALSPSFRAVVCLPSCPHPSSSVTRQKRRGTSLYPAAHHLCHCLYLGLQYPHSTLCPPLLPIPYASLFLSPAGVGRAVGHLSLL